MRMPPICALTLALAAGIALGLRLGGGVELVLGVGCAAAAGVLLVRGRALVLGLTTAAGWALGAAAAAQAAGDCRVGLPDGGTLVVEGAFEARPWAGAAAPFRLKAVRAADRAQACAGTIRVKLGERVRAPPAGARLVAVGKWWAQPPEGRWPRPAERAGVLTLDSVRVLSSEARASAVLGARGRAQALVRELFGRRAPLAESLILAQQGGIDAETRDRWAASGLSHLLAISGSHVALVAAIMLLLAQAARLAARPAALVAAGATIAYVLFLGAPVPALRSCVQLALLLAARLLQRPTDARALVAAGALVVLVLSPIALVDPGFQLSFGGVLGILLLRPRLLPWVAPLRAKWLRESIATSLAATLATSPIAAAQFGRVAPIGVLANLAAVPLCGLAVPAVALAMAVGAAAPAVGHFLAGGATLLLDALDLVARAAAAVPGGHALVPTDRAWAWALAALGAAVVAAAGTATAGLGAGSVIRGHSRAAATATSSGSGSGSRSGSQRPSRRPRFMAAGTAGALLLLWPVALGLAGSGRVDIWAIDVGQGDAIAIRSPAGRWVLVDAGPRDERFDAGQARVVPFLLAHGAERLQALVLTHADADHVGGAAAVLGALRVEEVLEPGIALGRPLYLEALRTAQARGTRWLAAREGRELALDGLTLRVLAPAERALDAGGEVNELCVVFSLEYGSFRALFMGDAPLEVEEELVREHAGELRADVVKIGHHGSAGSSGDALLEAALPRAALVSVGRHNRFGHPAPAALRRLERHGVRVYRTDRGGALHVSAAPGGAWKVETAR